MIRAFVNNDGEISTPDMMDFKAEIAKQRNHEVELTCKRRQRTSKQNRTLHWGLNIYVEGLQELGYKIDLESFKYELEKKGFWGWVEYETKDGVQTRPKKTHELSTDECADGFERLQTSARSYDIIIPDPDPDR